jgi:SIR2-like domain
MEEKLLSLAFSVEANKGVYALLLGSGISSSAGIPTGWGILKELCRRIMELEGETEEDAIQWYEKKYGKAPLYDEVIGKLARTSAERNGLLREFFEPTEEDIKENRKIPTEAHRAIAELVKQGYIKVIITTNFDRLIEQSLDELNVQYQTLYHDSDIEGMKPLAHSECTILKIHGDYRDTRFKNVTDELKSYSEPLTELLKRIFDEYGLIISGWSAEWDTALRDIIKSVKGRRYSWYWHSFTDEINEKAKELISFRDATVIVDRGGADHFFRELAENVFSISKIKRVNPESLQVKIKRLKSYIANNQEIEIRELITDETKKLVEFINNINAKGDVSKEIVEQYVEEIKEKAKPLSILISLLSYYVQTTEQERLLIETLERLTTIRNYEGTTLLINLQQLPLQIALYSIGISLVKSNNYNLLDKVFVLPKVRDRLHTHLSFLEYTSSARTKLLEIINYIDPGNRFHLPVEEIFMYPYMEKIFLESQLVFDREEYTIYYDYFEFLRCIKHRYLGNRNYFSGRFGFKYDRNHIYHFLQEGSVKENWEVLVLCGQSKYEFIRALRTLVEDLDSQAYFSGQGLLEAYLGESK